MAIRPRGPLGGAVAAPGSKSHTNRALVAAALAMGESRLRQPLAADDVRCMVEGLRSLGVDVTLEGDTWVVGGTGGRLGGAGGRGAGGG
ncbi:MAG: 3-phosphoshikimate 1-carboxyvinyltransferase, partial [Acidimicrobiales bacterium]